MSKTYSAWVSIISYIMLAILAFVKLKTNNPSDIVFVLIECLLCITFYVSGFFFMIGGER